MAHIPVPVSGKEASYSLVELLAVLAVLGVLAAMTWGFADGARQRAAVARARAELAAVAQALEAYRLQYGDYPQTGGCPAKGAELAAGDPLATTHAEAKLFNALLGKLGPGLDPLRDRAGGAILGRELLDTERLTVENPAAFPTAGAEAANALLDPWGRRYQYFYRDPAAPAGWRAAAYVLFSVGPDGLAKPGDPAPDGTVDSADPRNADNLYAGPP